jgi:hypothetical protein
MHAVHIYAECSATCWAYEAVMMDLSTAWSSTLVRNVRQQVDKAAMLTNGMLFGGSVVDAGIIERYSCMCTAATYQHAAVCCANAAMFMLNTAALKWRLHAVQRAAALHSGPLHVEL